MKEPADLAAFKNAFRRHAAGVSVITALHADGTPVGFTATSLASLSAIPPLATFNMARSATSWPAILGTDRVAVHMLGSRNQGVAEIMSRDAAKRFDGDHWHVGAHGLPILNEASAILHCRILQRFEVHTGALVVVQIESGDFPDVDAAPDTPLLYAAQGYFTPPPASGEV